SLKPPEKDLWVLTHKTIASVTESFSQTYALNTIISDLMTLTNVLWDTPPSSDTAAMLRYLSLTSLLRMLAPIAPAFCEECWETLHLQTARELLTHPNHPITDGKGGIKSIFTHP